MNGSPHPRRNGSTPGASIGAAAEAIGPGGERLAWIFGSSRSGSTWLLRMLGELDDVAAIDDPHIGHHLGVWRPISLAWGAGEEDEPELRTLPELKRERDSYFFNRRYEHAWRPALRELIAARFSAEATDRVAGARPVATIVKEPGSQVADLLLSLFPRSRLIFLLRDGRDVVDSWVDAYRRDSWAIEEGAFAAGPSGREALVRWQSSVWAYRTAAVREAYERHDPGRRVLVRYEDLLADQVRELDRVCAALGLLPREAEREQALERAAARHRFSRLPDGQAGSGHRQRLAQPGAWRYNLTRAEIAAMEEIMGPELEWATGQGAAARATSSAAA